MVKKSFLAVLLLFVIKISFGQSDTLFNYAFENSTDNWTVSADSTELNFIQAGAQTPGSAQVTVTYTGGNVKTCYLYSPTQDIAQDYQEKMLVVVFYAKADTTIGFRTKLEITGDNGYRAVKVNFSISENFEKYAIPFKLRAGDKRIKIKFEIGSQATNYYFDDVALLYVPYKIKDIQQIEKKRKSVFTIPQKNLNTTLDKDAKAVDISINADKKVASVLQTQIGVNSNFRSKNSLVDRADLYQCFGAFRYPAGSGSDMFYWDGNVPSYLSGYSGTSSKFLDVEHFAEFKALTTAQASVVVNYAYARLGQTPEGTRESKVSQAAEYAAGFVNRLNNELGANVRYWEVGNENYGAWEAGYEVDGKVITGKEYGEDFCVFADSMKKVDAKIKVGAVLSHNDFNWNRQVLSQAGDKADYLIFHHYLTGVDTYEGAKGAIGAVEEDILELELLATQLTDKPFGAFPVNMTEYNSQGYHTTTMINGLFTAYMIGTFIKNKINLATIWVNEWRVSDDESHGILSLDDERQDDYTPRPAYVPYYYYDKMFGSIMVKSSVVQDTAIVAFASKFDSGELGIVLINYDSTQTNCKLNIEDSNDYNKAYFYQVYASNIEQGNTKFYVNGLTSETEGGGPQLDSVPVYCADYSTENTFSLPAYSVTFIVLANQDLTNSADINSDIKIYPNPAKDKITISTENISDGVKLKITSLNGKTLKQSRINGKHTIIDISDLNSGVYLLKIKGKEKVYFKKFIVK